MQPPILFYLQIEDYFLFYRRFSESSNICNWEIVSLSRLRWKIVSLMFCQAENVYDMIQEGWVEQFLPSSYFS